MILWNYLSGEVLTDIHALADYFSLILSCAYLVSTIISGTIAGEKDGLLR
jgi:hypothetical protein